MNTKNLFFIIGLVIVLVLSAVACGDDDDNNDNDTQAKDSGTADAGGQDSAVADSGDSGTKPADATMPEGPTVTTPKGKVRGTLSNGVRAFLGIPYGAPPVGEKRWAPPEPAASWTETRDSTKYGNICPQISSLTQTYDDTANEDCLFLNVWTTEAEPATKLPVMVWFHGGAFVFGSGGSPAATYFAGDGLVKTGNVVVVTVNYRLSAMGFFAHPALTAEAKAANRAPTNFGIMDQQLALKWVQENIGAFGGDKNNVTLFGQSAGGASVAIHMISEGSKGLFHRAIVESGMVILNSPTLAQIEAVGQRYATGLGCTDSDPAKLLSCLRALTPKVVTIGPSGVVTLPGGIFYQDGTKSYSLFPSIDNVVYPEQIEAALAAGRIAKVPVLQGATTNEGILFHTGLFGDKSIETDEQYKVALTNRFGALADQVLAKYPSKDDIVKVSAEAFFRCPAIRAANYLAAAGVKNYLYSFDLPLAPVITPKLEGQAFHSAEIPYVFGTVSYTLGKVPSGNAEVAKAIMAYWTTFAAKGDPNSSGATEWPAYDATGKSHMNLANPLSVSNTWDADCEFWNSLIPKS